MYFLAKFSTQTKLDSTRFIQFYAKLFFGGFCKFVSFARVNKLCFQRALQTAGVQSSPIYTPLLVGNVCCNYVKVHSKTEELYAPFKISTVICGMVMVLLFKKTTFGYRLVLCSLHWNPSLQLQKSYIFTFKACTVRESAVHLNAMLFKSRAFWAQWVRTKTTKPFELLRNPSFNNFHLDYYLKRNWSQVSTL